MVDAAKMEWTQGAHTPAQVTFSRQVATRLAPVGGDLGRTRVTRRHGTRIEYERSGPGWGCDRDGGRRMSVETASQPAEMREIFSLPVSGAGEGPAEGDRRHRLPARDLHTSFNQGGMVSRHIEAHGRSVGRAVGDDARSPAFWALPIATVSSSTM